MEEKSYDRSDVMNGLALAGVLLFLLLLILFTAWRCTSSLGDLTEGEKRAAEVSTTLAVVDEGPDASEAAGPARDPAEVTVRVGNGANKSGLAASGTQLLAQSEYNMLEGRTKEGATVAESFAYYNESFAGDAVRIASLLSIDEERVLPMPEDPGVPIDTADVVVILGEDAEF